MTKKKRYWFAGALYRHPVRRPFSNSGREPSFSLIHCVDSNNQGVSFSLFFVTQPISAVVKLYISFRPYCIIPFHGHVTSEQAGMISKRSIRYTLAWLGYFCGGVQDNWREFNSRPQSQMRLGCNEKRDRLTPCRGSMCISGSSRGQQFPIIIPT